MKKKKTGQLISKKGKYKIQVSRPKTAKYIEQNSQPDLNSSVTSVTSLSSLSSKRFASESQSYAHID